MGRGAVLRLEGKQGKALLGEGWDKQDAKQRELNRAPFTQPWALQKQQVGRQCHRSALALNPQGSDGATPEQCFGEQDLYFTGED